jgi:hypothetical protein
MIRALNIYIIALGAHTKYCVRSLASDPQPTIPDVGMLGNFDIKVRWLAIQLLGLHVPSHR